MKRLAALACSTLLLAGVAAAQEVNGSLTANGKSGASAEPLHPAFTTFLSSAAFVRWQPAAYDEKRVAGRLWTEGSQNEFRQQWSYDVTFSAPIALDPAAKTVPRK